MPVTHKPSSQGSDSPAKPTRQKIGIVDIARESGLSTGLVSAFLSGNYSDSKRKSKTTGVSDESRQRIRKACKKLRYQPENPLWRARVYPEQADLTFLLSSAVGLGFGNDYFGRMILSLAEVAKENGIRAGFAIFDPDYDYSTDTRNLPPGTTEGLANKFVLAGPINNSLVERLIEQESAVVFISRASGISGTVSIVPDYEAAAGKALEMLYAHGHRRIAVAGAHYYNDNGYNFRLLKKGILRAKSDLCLPISEADIHISNEKSLFKSSEFLKSILQHDEAYSAVFCLDDSTAHALYIQAENIGCQIPERLSIVGCNDESVASILKPALSTIHFPVRRIGSRAMKESIRVIEQGRPSGEEIIILPTAPILRQSICHNRDR